MRSHLGSWLTTPSFWRCGPSHEPRWDSKGEMGLSQSKKRAPHSVRIHETLLVNPGLPPHGVGRKSLLYSKPSSPTSFVNPFRRVRFDLDLRQISCPRLQRSGVSKFGVKSRCVVGTGIGVLIETSKSVCHLVWNKKPELLLLLQNATSGFMGDFPRTRRGEFLKRIEKIGEGILCYLE